ncbi:MAG: hypothetical protein WCP60_11380 [bacterium]
MLLLRRPLRALYFASASPEAFVLRTASQAIDVTLLLQSGVTPDGVAYGNLPRHIPVTLVPCF